jgi:hypothetical protein
MATVTLDTPVEKTIGSDSIMTDITKGVGAPAFYDANFNYQQVHFIYCSVGSLLVGYALGAMKGEKVALGQGDYAIKQLHLF